MTPHHLWFTNDTCDYRVNPPIRTADDVEALVEGIQMCIRDRSLSGAGMQTLTGFWRGWAHRFGRKYPPGVGL